MQVHENFSLKVFNTFGVACKARFFAAFKNFQELTELAGRGRMMILGGGSNVLFCGDYDGWVLKNEILGITIAREDEDFVYLKCGGGENWHKVVMDCVSNGWGGVENLSLIPGCVGASPMQNIGAYGVEIKDVFEELEAYDLEDRKVVTFTTSDCEFGYRESVFKTVYKDRFVILHVTFRLRRKPVFNISYGAIASKLERMGVTELSVRAVSDAVISIRQSKLPDPAVLGNAGSFFKNPVVNETVFGALRSKYDLPFYPLGDHQYKIPAGWLIEQCGWRGRRAGDVGCYEKQALVLVNYGEAPGFEIFRFSSQIVKSIAKQFGIVLEREVNIIDCLPI